MPAIVDDRRDHQVEEVVEIRDDLLRDGVLGERREANDVDEHDRHLDRLAIDVRPAGHDPLGDRGIDVGTHGGMQRLALTQAGDHPIEAVHEHEMLIGARQRDPDSQVAGRHGSGSEQ